MAEKRVSVRLSAVGGRQVRAELEGIWAAGSRGFTRISREMDLATARLAAFTRRAKLAAAAAGAAVATAGVAMVRSGLQTVDAQAKLAQSLGTTVASLQRLARAGELAGVGFSGIEQATKDMTRRLSQAATAGGPVAEALDRLNLSAGTLLKMPLDERIAAVSSAMEDLIPVTQRAAVAGQIFGEEGSIAMSRIDTATLRQASEDVRDFGVVVSEADADQIERTNDALSRLGLIWRGVSNQLAVAAAPALEAVANAMAALARSTGPLGQAIGLAFDNIGRLGAYAATFAGVMAGRWVASLALAALSVKGLTLSLVALRGALIRTGIGVLIVGAGELVHQFARLAIATGGIGTALSLLRDLAVQAWDRLALSAAAAWFRVEAGWAAAQAGILDGLQGALEAVTGWGNRAVGTFQGAFDAVKAIWGALPKAIGDFAYRAANGLISGVEAMLNAVVTRINGFIEGLNAALALLPDWATGGDGIRIGTLGAVDLGGLANPFEGAAVAAGDAAGAAFQAAMGKTYVAAPDLFGGMAEAARGRSSAYAEAADKLSQAAARPLPAWAALKDAVTGTEAALDDTATVTGDLTEGFDQAAAAGGRAGAAGKTAAEETRQGWEAVRAALADYADQARRIGAGVGDALVGAFRSAEEAVGNFVRTGKLDFRELVTSMLADLAKLSFRTAVTGPLAGWLAGAFSGAGRAGTTALLGASILHAGGTVGLDGPQRQVPAALFAGAPRMHAGGWPGLRPDEVPAILQRGERVLSRSEAQRAGGGPGSGGGTVDLRVFVEGGSLKAEVVQLSGEVAARVVEGYDRALPRRLQQIGRDPRKV